MPSEKTVLTCMPLGDLQAAARKLQVAVIDRRRKDALVSGLLKAKEQSFETVLGAMAAPALKAACEELQLDLVGRGKAACVAALVASVPAKKAAKAPAKAAKPAGAAKAPQGAKRKQTGPVAASKTKTPASTPQGKAAAKAEAAPKKQAVRQAAAGPKATPKLKSKSATTAPVRTPPAAAAKAPEPAAVTPVPTAPAAPLPAAEPAKKAPAAKRGPLSWSEAALMAAHRGQSAQTMLRPPVPQATGTAQHTCLKCHAKVTVQACQVQACNNYYVAAPNRKICSECLFERNTISMDDFNDRLHEERLCTSCGVPMTHLASGGNA